MRKTNKSGITYIKLIYKVAPNIKLRNTLELKS